MAALVCRLEDSVPLHGHSQSVHLEPGSHYDGCVRKPYGGHTTAAARVQVHSVQAHTRQCSSDWESDGSRLHEDGGSSPTAMCNMNATLAAKPQLLKASAQAGWYGGAEKSVTELYHSLGRPCPEHESMPAECDGAAHHLNNSASCADMHTGTGSCVKVTLGAGESAAHNCHTIRQVHSTDLTDSAGASNGPSLESLQRLKALRNALVPERERGMEPLDAFKEVGETCKEGECIPSCCDAETQDAEAGPVEHTDVVGIETVSEVLCLRQLFLQFRDCRNAVTAAAGGARSATDVAAFDPVATIEAVADAVIDDVIEEHVDELLAVCDNCVDVLFAQEFACNVDDGWAACTAPDMHYLTLDSRQGV
jgi:hypothetical protein